MKIGVLQSAFDRMQGPNKPIYDQALADLKQAGVSMTTVDYQEDMGMIRFLLEAEAAAAFDDITRDGQVRKLRGQGAGDWPNSFRGSRLIPAVEYIRAQMQRMGLEPGNNGDWFQTVPMVETTADPATTLNLSVNGKPHVLKFGDDMVIELTGDELRLRSRRAAIKRVQAMVRQYIPDDKRSLADELIAERRAEAAREERK